MDADYAHVWKNYGSVDGTLYGLYFKAAHKSTVWYSPDALDPGRREAARSPTTRC